MPLGTYSYRDTSAHGLSVTAPVATHAVHVSVNPDKVMRLRQLHGV